MILNFKIMKIRKLFTYFALLLFFVSLGVCETSCQASYRNVRKVTHKKKSRNHASRHAYRGQRVVKAKAGRPINTAYTMKTKRRNTYHY